MVDVVGLGAGVVDRLRELKIKNVVAFNAGERAVERDRFTNRRAETYWQFREDMENGKIDLPPAGEDDELKAQLGAIKWTVDSSGRIKIESKDDMKKRGLPSPDRADACVMSAMRGALRVPNADQRAAMAARETLTGDLLERGLRRGHND